jgi:hypothetical protein
MDETIELLEGRSEEIEKLESEILKMDGNNNGNPFLSQTTSTATLGFQPQPSPAQPAKMPIFSIKLAPPPSTPTPNATQTISVTSVSSTPSIPAVPLSASAPPNETFKPATSNDMNID